MKIEDKIDEYVNKRSIVGAKMEKNTFFSNKKQYYYKDKNDLIRILKNLYKDDTKEAINDYAGDIIDFNKDKKIAYTGEDPFAVEIRNSIICIGVFSSQKELEEIQKESANNI